MLKYGDTREDGYVWVGKRYNIRRPDGSYADDWRSPKALKRKIEKNKVNKKIVYNLIKEVIDNYKIKKGCACCGYNKKAIGLDFHHLDKTLKTINISSYWKTSWKQFEKIKKAIEEEKCIVLCAICHRIEEERIRNE